MSSDPNFVAVKVPREAVEKASSSRPSWPDRGPGQWLLGIVAILIVAILQAAVSYAFTSNAASARADVVVDEMRRRLDRIEAKVDRIESSRVFYARQQQESDHEVQ